MAPHGISMSPLGNMARGALTDGKGPSPPPFLPSIYSSNLNKEFLN